MATATPPAVPPEMLRIACDRCAGGFELTELATPVLCPFCSHLQEVPRAVIDRLVEYGVEVETALEAAASGGVLARRWQILTASGRITNWLVVGLMLAGLAWIAVSLSGSREAYAHMGPALLALQFGMFGLLGLAAVGVVVRMVRGGRGKVKGAEFTSDCPGCGAANRLKVGQVFRSCQHCRADLVPSDAVMAAGVSLATAQRRAVRLAGVRAERVGMAQIGRRQRLMGGVTKLTIVVVPTVASLFMLQQVAQGSEKPEAPLLWGGIAVAALLGVGGKALLQWLGERNAKREFHELASRRGGTFLDGLDGAVDWLNALWPEGYGSGYNKRKTGGPGFYAASFSRRGFPVLATAFVRTLVNRKEESFLDVLVATVDSRFAKPDRAAVKALRKSLAEKGVRVETSPSGLVATAAGDRFAALENEQLAQSTVAIAGTLTQMAQALGRRPALPIS